MIRLLPSLLITFMIDVGMARPLPAQAPLRLSGINFVSTDASGNIIEAFWTTDHTPTPHNWFGIWVSDAPDGAFRFGQSQNDLSLPLGISTTTSYFLTADFAPPHAGTPQFTGVNLFFNGEVAPRISFVSTAFAQGSFAAIAPDVATPGLLYFPQTKASGVTSFSDGDVSYSLTEFTYRLGADRVYADQARPDGYLDPEFHLGLTVTTPEPASVVLFATGLLAVALARRRRCARGC